VPEINHRRKAGGLEDGGVRRGRAAEDLARAYLEEQGFRIVGRNLRLADGELDLVAWDGATLVFVEVKARSHGGHGRPEEAVDARKRRRLVSAARAYLARLAQPLPPCRFDVVALDLLPGKAAGAGGGEGRVLARGKDAIRHLRDAFRPGE